MEDDDLKELIGFDPNITDAELEKQLKEVDDGEDPMATLKELGILDEDEGENDPSEQNKQTSSGPAKVVEKKEDEAGKKAANGSQAVSSSSAAAAAAAAVTTVASSTTGATAPPTTATTTTPTAAPVPAPTAAAAATAPAAAAAAAAAESSSGGDAAPAAAAATAASPAPAAASPAPAGGPSKSAGESSTGAPVPETREEILAKMAELRKKLEKAAAASTTTTDGKVPPAASATPQVAKKEEEDKKRNSEEVPAPKREEKKKKSTVSTKSRRTSNSSSGTRKKSSSASTKAAKAPTSRRKRKRAIKVIVVGNSKCGKTSIINRYVKDVFSNEYKYTIGCDYSMKEVNVTPDVQVRLQLWDIAGQDRFIHLSRAFYKKSAGAILVCDVTRAATLEAVRSWKKEIDKEMIPEAKEKGINIPVIMIANKVDLLPNIAAGMQVGANVQALAEELELDGWFMGSAKLNDKIDDAMMFLLKKIIGIDAVAPKKEKDVKDFNSNSQFLKGSTPEKAKKSKSSSKSSSRRFSSQKSKKILKLERRGSLGKRKDKDCTLL